MEPTIGEIRMFGGTTLPFGWALCDGSEVPYSDSDYTQLYSLIGNTYGPAPTGYFRLPDLCGRLVVGAGDDWAVGSKRGRDTVEIKEAEMAPHGHGVLASTAAATTPLPTASSFFGQANGNTTAALFGFMTAGASGSTTAKLNAQTVVPAGDPTAPAHANTMPSLAINFMICLRGVYPDPPTGQPVVTSIQPRRATPSGTSTSNQSGALSVVIGGYGFGPNPIVQFGSAQAQVLGATSSSITVQCPPGDGTVTVTVTSNGRTSVPTANNVFEYAPSITEVSPPFGRSEGGNKVVIKGIGLRDTATVNFGATPVGFTQPMEGNAEKGLYVSDTKLELVAPAQTGAGDVAVTVKLKNGATSIVTPAAQYSYWPTVIAISPERGPPSGGGTATISGLNFGPNCLVSFNGTPVRGTVSGDKITFAVPPGTGHAIVGVLAPGQTRMHGVVVYSYLPRVNSITPNAGPPGTTVTVWGENFAPPYGVWFGNTPGTIVGTPSAGQIQATSPSGSGTVPVAVSSAGGASDAATAPSYSYAPQIFSLNPSTGPINGGTTVQIVGSAFTSNLELYFNGSPMAVTYFSSTLASFVTPVMPSGTDAAVCVQTAAGVSNTVNYTYGLSVTAISPTTLPATGGQLTITGAGFAPGMTVNFGSQQVANVTIVNAQTATCTAPPGTSDNVWITVSLNGVTSQSGCHLSYMPIVTSFAPTQGPAVGGTIVTINGAGFVPGNTQVFFGVTAAASVTVDPSTLTLTAVAPPMPGQQTTLRVQTAAGLSPVVSPLYSFTPCIVDVRPNFGPPTGGERVTLAGVGLSGATKVMFGSWAAQIESGNDREIWALTPQGGTGTCYVSVSTADGSSGQSAEAMYTFGPTVTSISPNCGPPDGGTQVTVSGYGLSTARGVLFGDIQGRILAPPTDNQLICSAPPGFGSAPVQVLTQYGRNRIPTDATYFNYFPKIVSVVSAAGADKAAVGAWILITAKGLQPVPPKNRGVVVVYINGTIVSFGMFRGDIISLALPDDVKGTALITLNNGYGIGPPYAIVVG